MAIKRCPCLALNLTGPLPCHICGELGAKVIVRQDPSDMREDRIPKPAHFYHRECKEKANGLND